MRLRLLNVGKPSDAHAIALHDRYAERLRQLGVAYEAAWVRATRPGGRYSDEHVRKREATALLAQWDGRGTLVAVDPDGTSWSSEELGRRCPRWATPVATLLIGGPLGLHDDVLARAEVRWSLSPLTFPHELARVIVVEQLYRAVTLQRGLPYHKGAVSW